MLVLGKKIYSVYKTKGIRETIFVILKRIFKQKPKSLPFIKEIVSHGKGIEIGGPSTIFQSSNVLPIYADIEKLDNCNFQNNTLWNSNLKEGYSYKYHPSKVDGYQFIQDSVDLSQIESESYEFLLSSHVLEHIANPIKALEEWKRILKVDGHLILLVPHKDGTFDHNRPTTALKHLINDYENEIKEDDLTHLEEILQLHDLLRDPEAGSHENFKTRSYDNYQNRSLHHHVFTTLLLAELIDYMQLKIVAIEPIDPMHIIIVAQKLSANADIKNDALLGSLKISSFKSPFYSDRP